MDYPSVIAQGIGKEYRIGAQQSAGYRTVRESLSGLVRSPVGLLRRGRSGAGTTFWALKDINFTITHGEVVGVIGRNGAGKSTLLKILSRITEPTEGTVEIHGRVGSLLEVGTGFHPELTGRENIYLNGAILGMTRKDIQQRFDEIVGFADIGGFLDTQVKFYSSGMYARLAFSVAAHLEPEVLIVDEVLAVGDAAFQRKCLNKMESVGKEGRTVIFVSHNMSAVTRLCSRAILLHAGHIVADGPAPEVAARYIRGDQESIAERLWTPEDAAASRNGAYSEGSVLMAAVRVLGAQDAVAYTHDIRSPMRLEMEFDVLQDTPPLCPHFYVYSADGTLVFPTLDVNPEWRSRPRSPGRYRSGVTVPGNFLSEGDYLVSAGISSLDPFRMYAGAPESVAFHVVDSLDGDTARGDFAGPLPGAVRPLLPWYDMVLEEASLRASPH